MTSTTLLRGFKVSVATLDAFLKANQFPGTYGIPPFYEDHPDNDNISALLFKKVTQAGGSSNKMNFRLMIPARDGHNPSSIAYITYTWVTVYAHLRVDLEHDLPDAVPNGFSELRDEVISHSQDKTNTVDGQMGLFLVSIDGLRGLYTPQELLDRDEAPQLCDQCNATFDNPDAWAKRQRHRAEAHGTSDGTNPLPNA